MRWLDDLPEWAAYSVVLGGVVGLILGVVYLGASCSAYTSIDANLAEIAVVRQAALDVRPDQAEDVAGQVADMNRIIATAKVWNRKWYADLLYPDAWDTVTTIAMPPRTLQPEQPK